MSEGTLLRMQNGEITSLIKRSYAVSMVQYCEEVGLSFLPAMCKTVAGTPSDAHWNCAHESLCSKLWVVAKTGRRHREELQNLWDMLTESKQTK